MTTNIVLHEKQRTFSLERVSDSPSEKHRIKLFTEYLSEKNLTILNADLSEYRDYLIEEKGFALSSVAAILSTLRERYRQIAHDNKFIKWLGAGIAASEPELSFEQVELRVQALLRSIENNSDSRNSRVKQHTVQDLVDSQRLWLNGFEDELLKRASLAKPDIIGVRNAAMHALLLATGIRREELTSLLVDDLFEKFQGVPALLVRRGKGDKQRAVIYGDLWDKYIKPYVLPWAEFVDSGFLFRGFWRGYTKLRDTKLNVASVNEIISELDIEIDGKTYHISPHDWRRTYAKMLFQDYGMTVLGVQQQMGHSDEATTRHYIGDLDIEFRIPQLRKE